ncbi:MAG: ABC transporter substrate-binding protein, partial [Chloroflexales bacterium]|nr:ABC transporter substrate-binding protein [Chloroflexales bacterium]
MYQKRILSLLSSLIVAMLILAACGGAPPAQNPPDAPDTDTPTDAPNTDTSTDEPDTEVPPDEPDTDTSTDEPDTEATGGQGRGAGDTLRILYWQAPTTLNTHLATGTKDYDASRLILEPLAAVDSDGNLVPLLVKEIPTLENGGIAEDLSSITWNLRQDITWSDGSPFTAEDVVFTYDYCADEATACTTATVFQGIASVEAMDDYTVKITWEAPTTNQYKTFVSSNGRILQKAQFGDCIGEAAGTEADCQAANLAPIGTGPYKLVAYTPGDRTVIERNPDYWGEPQHWDKVTFRPITSDGPRVAALLAGDVDLIDKPALQDLDQIES